MSVEENIGKKRWGCWLVSVVLGLLGIVLLGLPMLNQANGSSHSRNCAGNLKQIGLALIIYAGDDPDSGYFPDGSTFEPLHSGRYLLNGKVYACPSALGPDTLACQSNYVYRGTGLKDTNANYTHVILAHDRIGNHKGWVNYLYVDGHVKGEKSAATTNEELRAECEARGAVLP